MNVQISVQQWLLKFTTNQPFTIFAFFILIFIIYKVVTFTEVIIVSKIICFINKFQVTHFIKKNYPVVVPISVRQIPGQTLPPHFPNGWIPILESFAISANQVKSVLCFGTELAVVRGSEGQVYVFDAFCPHLGANFAVGGTVQQNDCKEDCIRCPFHGWSFRMTDGTCFDIPYEKSKLNN